jgi:hypothetical protein
MNTYNDNLHAGVMDSLLQLDQDVKKINSQANAAMFTLYYAEGAVITARDKLDGTKSKQLSQEAIKEQAVNNSNVLNNLQASAMQANQYVKQSALDMATAAANVQIASNAIVRLSSDIGSIYNIVQAANFDSEISEQAAQANGFISKTAYGAETASQTAMEASVLVAKIPASTVEDKAKSTNKLMGDLLKVVSDNYDAVSQKVADNNKALAAASSDEKKAEGAFANLHTIKRATNVAYQLTNRELNLNLTVTPAEDEKKSVDVLFDLIKSPFRDKEKNILYPVKDYYLFLVKDKQKLNFTSSTAESILLHEGSQRFVNFHDDFLPTAKRTQSYFSDKVDVQSIRNKHSHYPLRDSDGDPIAVGVNYVAFLLAAYDEQYKKKLNSFDDYLSAPSTAFCFTHQLGVAKFHTSSHVLKITNEKEPASLHFTVHEDPEVSKQVEYRCILLPVYDNPSVTGMTNATSLAELDEEITRLEAESKQKHDEIISLQQEQNALGQQIDEERNKNLSLLTDVAEELMKSPYFLEGKRAKEVAEVFMNDYKPENEEDAKSLAEHSKLVKDHVVALAKFHRNAQKLLQRNKEKEVIDATLQLKHKSKIGFLFNLELAQQVSAGNYTVAKQVAGKWTISIDESTTDNFGNLLIKGGKLYTPVILSVSTAPDGDVSPFTNTWTGYEQSPRFSVQ